MTIAALLGTGLATLGFALSGVSALGDDLQAARTAAPAASTPVLTPSEERSEAAPSAPGPAAPSLSPADELRLQQACDRKRRSDRDRDQLEAKPTGAPAASATSPAKEY